ncbi:MAG: YraN family protein [Hyphomicrobiaceae bacterium]
MTQRHAHQRRRIDPAQRPERRRAIEKAARRAESLAVLVMIIKGYRIIGRRVRTTSGEIDIIACRGRRLAFVEVKQRRTLAEAEQAVTPAARARMARAVEAWLSRYPEFLNHDIGLDRFEVVSLFRFRYAPDTLHTGAAGR